MNKTLYLATFSWAVLAMPALADTRDDVMGAMQRCSVMRDDRSWLECTYGAQQLMRAKLGLPPAPDYQQRLVPPAPSASMPAPIQSVSAPVQAPAKPVASAPQPHRRGGFFGILAGSAPPVAVSTLASVRYDSEGDFTITLQNGQIWHQVNAETGLKAKLTVGSKVTITPGAMWSYNLKTDDSSHVYKVERKI